jgi:hypothetical protein
VRNENLFLTVLIFQSQRLPIDPRHGLFDMVLCA